MVSFCVSYFFSFFQFSEEVVLQHKFEFSHGFNYFLKGGWECNIEDDVRVWKGERLKDLASNKRGKTEYKDVMHPLAVFPQCLSHCELLTWFNVLNWWIRHYTITLTRSIPIWWMDGLIWFKLSGHPTCKTANAMYNCLEAQKHRNEK